MSLEQYISLKYDPEKPFWKPDKFEFIFLLCITMFVFCVTYNFTLLNISDNGIPLLTPIVEKLKWMVVQFIAIASLGFAGPILRIITNNVQLKDEKGNYMMVADESGQKVPLTLTSTTTEGFWSANSIIETFIGFGIAFGLNSVVSFLIFRYAMSIFNLTLSQISFAVITSVSEELLFSYGFQRVFEPYLQWLAVPLGVGLFVIYHQIVYAGEITALIYVAAGRLIYASIYLWNRRVSSVILAHMANNIMAFQSTAPAFSIFGTFFSLLL